MLFYYYFGNNLYCTVLIKVTHNLLVFYHTAFAPLKKKKSSLKTMHYSDFTPSLCSLCTASCGLLL